MDNPYIRGLRIQKKSVGKRLYAAICLMLVAALLVSTTSYAWLILSQAPEVTDVTTTLGANGNLEIALATTDHLALLESNNMYDDDSNFEYANGDAVHDNILWGNLIDLTPSDYGLHILNMRPAILNIMDGYVADAPISIGKYGADGRLENLTYDAENINLDTIGFSSVYNTDKANYYAGSVEMSIDDLKSGNYDKEALIQSILDNREYGVRIAGLLDYSATVDQSQNSANIDILVDGYCFAIDLLFRTNTPTANLMLQTEGTQRMESELEDEYVGSGSFVEMDNKRLSAAMKVVFANTLTGEVYALAQADSEGKLWITARADENGTLIPTEADDAALIKPLTQNQVSAITAWVFVDGSKVDNSAATTLVATAAKINLQFSTDAVLNPAYTDITTNPNYPNRPEIPVDPDTPVGPEIPAAAEYFISADREDNYTIYTLAGSGRRNYELHFTGSLDESTNTVTLNHVSEYPKKGIIIPACVMLSESETEYAVQIDPTQGPFADLETENASVFFVPVDGKKVSVTSNVLSNLFYQTGKDNLYDLDKVFVSLDLSGLDTSTATDMRELFRGCSRLTYLNLDGVDTSNVTDMSYMFVNCEALTALDVSGFNTAKVTEMQYLFAGCSGLTELAVQNFNTENVWNMECMFNECSSLTKLDVSSFNTSSVYYMRGMFDSCSGLTELNLSNFDTTKVGDMRNMFLQCTALKKLDVSSFNTESVENMNCMFSGCSSLTELDLSSFNTENVTDMQTMFSSCSNLAELDLSNFNTQKVEKMNSMFSGCTNLTKLDVSNFDTENVWNMGSIFSGCASLTRLDLSSWDVSNINYNVILDNVFGNCKNLYIIVTPKEIGSKTIKLPGTYLCEVDGKRYTEITSSIPTRAGLKNVTLDGPSTEPPSSETQYGPVSNARFEIIEGFLNLVYDYPEDVSSARNDIRYHTVAKLNGIDTDIYMNTTTNRQKLSPTMSIGEYSDITVQTRSPGFIQHASVTFPELRMTISQGENTSQNLYVRIDNPVYSHHSNDDPSYRMVVISGLTPSTPFKLNLYKGTASGSDFKWNSNTSLEGVSDACGNAVVKSPYSGADGDIAFSLVEYISTVSADGKQATIIQSLRAEMALLPANGYGEMQTQTGAIGNNISWTFTPDGTLTVTGSGPIPEGSVIGGYPWYALRRSVTNLVISDGITAVHGFHNFVHLETVTYGKDVKVSGSFSYCTSLKSFIPNDGLETVGSFRGCLALTTVILPDTVNELEVKCFVECESLETVVLSKSLTRIPQDAFAFCYKLNNVVIHEGVTSIGIQAFRVCRAMTNITLPASLKYVNYCAFEDCSVLTDIYYAGSADQWSQISISDYYNDPLLNATVHYADEE